LIANTLPMVVDTSASDADLGIYTGLYYIASQLASVAGPAINGYIVEWGGGDLVKACSRIRACTVSSGWITKRGG